MLNYKIKKFKTFLKKQKIYLNNNNPSSQLKSKLTYKTQNYDLNDIEYGIS